MRPSWRASRGSGPGLAGKKTGFSQRHGFIENCLLLAEGLHWIEPRGAVGRNGAGDYADEKQQGGRGGESDGIGWADVEEQAR